MSEKFDSIDLNCDAVLVEAYDGATVKHSPKGDSVDMGGENGSVDGFRVLVEGIDSEGVNGGIRHEGAINNLGFVKWASSVDGFRVFREAKECVDGASEGVSSKVDVKNGDLLGENVKFGCGRERNDGGYFSWVERGDRGEDAGHVFVGDERGNEGARVAQVSSCYVPPESSINGMGKSERKVMSDETNFIGGAKKVCNGTNSNLVDMNVVYNTRKDSLFGNGISNTETQVKELPTESNGGVNNVVSPSKRRFLHVNDDGNLEGKDGNDIQVVALEPKIRGELCHTEKEGVYYLSDMVWGKVLGHPWWPGQIFEPVAATENSMKYFKKDSYLIAYFGDQTFAWNEAARIKPFRMHFTQMEKQSNGGDCFREAVDCALDEVSRRVEFGLSCSCFTEERANISSQTVVNAGILEEASRRYEKDSISSASTFRPVELLQVLQSLAMAPKCRIGRLRFVIARAQLLAFSRWKGFNELPELVQLVGLSGEDGNIAAEKELMDDLMDGKVQGPSVDGESSGKSSVSEDAYKKSKGKRGRKKGFTMKHRAIESTSSDSDMKQRKTISSPKKSKVSPSRTKKFMKVGENAPRVASQLGTTFESGQKGLQSVKGVNGQNFFPGDIPSPEEMLAQLVSSASAPMEGYSSMNSLISLFFAFRNSVCLQKRNVPKRKRVTEEHDGENSAKSEGVEGIEDSYRTGRNTQSNCDELGFLEHKNLVEKTTAVSEPENASNECPNLGLVESEVENSAVAVDENTEEYSPTALSLKFSDLESLPSVTDLNKIFGRFGPLKELETQVMAKTKRAEVVFKRRLDAENAFSSAGKFGVFGPSLLCYRLKPLIAKTPVATKRKRKGAKSI